MAGVEVCSQVTGVGALRVRLELALLRLRVCFSFSLQRGLCPKGGYSWYECGSEAPRAACIGAAALLKCSPRLHLFPYSGVTDLKQGYGVEWAGLEHSLGWGLGYSGYGNWSSWATVRSVARSCDAVWVNASGLCLPGPYNNPGPLLHPRSSLFPGPGCPRPNTNLWCGLREAGMVIQVRLGTTVRQQPVGQTPLGLGTSQCPGASQEWSLACSPLHEMPSLWLDPLTPQAGHVSVLVITPLLLWVPPQGNRSLPEAFFPVPPHHVGILLASLVYRNYSANSVFHENCSTQM